MTDEELKREEAWLLARLGPLDEPEHIGVGGWLSHFPGEFEIVSAVDPVTGKGFDRIVRVKQPAPAPKPAQAGP